MPEAYELLETPYSPSHRTETLIPSMPSPSIHSDDDDHGNDSSSHHRRITRRVIHKLDYILLPFLALLFLVNSLDRSNIGNAETAHFTSDIGLKPHDLNVAVAWFFAFFVAFQPVGAALGRKFGITRWVPTCMAIWGVLTASHVWVHKKWQLVLIRILIGILEGKPPSLGLRDLR
jgi:Major Facilitator Superfamily